LSFPPPFFSSSFSTRQGSPRIVLPAVRPIAFARAAANPCNVARFLPPPPASGLLLARHPALNGLIRALLPRGLASLSRINTARAGHDRRRRRRCRCAAAILVSARVRGR
ncbi:unnamed protein product, partial [Ectocarpus fasciculatus]